MNIMNEKQLEYNFAITYCDHPGKIYGVTLSNLIKPLEMKEFVAIYSKKIKASTPQVAATYFCKYYGWVLAGVHYFNSINYNVKLSPSHIELQLFYDKAHDKYGLIFKIVKPSLQYGNREEIERDIEYLYKESVTPLLQAFVVETGIKIRELWGQLCIGIHFGYDLNTKEASSHVQKQNLLDDFTYLTKKLESKVVFNAKKNPLDMTFRMIPSAKNPEVYQRMKPTCCLYYLTEGATTKCYSCPRISKEERDARRQKVMERAN